MRELSLFTGAGGGLLGTHLLGWKPCGYVEWNEYCQRVTCRFGAHRMKRSGPLKRYAAMTPSGKRMKSSKPKMTPARKAAEGEDCTLMFAGCTNQNVVLCHLRFFNGGGEGMKPHDSEAVFGCDWCHNVLDGRQKPAPAWTMGDVAWALIKTMRRQRAKGVLIYKGEEA